MSKVMAFGLEVSVFELELSSYVHNRTIIFEKKYQNS